MSKKCPSCGACPECGARPNPYAVQPNVYPQPYGYPYPSDFPWRKFYYSTPSSTTPNHNDAGSVVFNDAVFTAHPKAN